MQYVHVTDAPLLMGDEVVDLLLEYSALLGRVGSADAVKIRAVNRDGAEVVVSMLLNAGTVLVAETTDASGVETPENGAAERYLRERIDSYGWSSVVPFGMDVEGVPDSAPGAERDATNR